MASVVSPDTNQDLQTSSRDPIHSSPVRSLVSRFEKKQEQNLDALPFRTVRNFFDGDDERSIHVTTEKQKYDTLMAKQRAEAEARRLQRSPEISIARKRIPSNAIQNPEEHIHVPMNPKEGNNPAEDEGEEEEEEETALPSLARKLELEFDDEVEHPQTIPEDEEVPNSIEEAVDIPPPPPPPPMEEETVLERKEFVNTPEQETKKRPMLTTERSFVMEEDHTIETEDLIVVCERFSTDGEEDREMLMEMLERQLHLVPQDEEELRRAMQANPSKARVLRRAYKYKRPENVPSKLFAPTAASLASRTTKSPSAVKKTTPTGPPAPSPSLGTTTPARRKSNKYANVQSKVKEMMKPSSPDDKTPTKAHRRRASDASDVSHTSSRSSMGGTSTPLRSTRTSQQNGASSADRRSFMSNKSSRRSSVNRTILDLHGDDGHSEWEGRHRSERLSFGSTSSTDSTDPFALQQSFLNRKSRYDTVQPRYLDYNKQSATYQRNKEAQQERRRKLEEANAAKSAERQKQLQYQLKLKEKREKEDLEQAVRRGEELHKMTQLLKEKEKVEDTERRKSQSMIRRALSGTGSVDTPSVGRRGGSTGSSVGASSPRTSLLSEPDSIPSSATSGARSNPVTAA